MSVRGVISMQGTDLSALFNTAAATNGIPTRVLVAIAIAESGLNEQAERHGLWPDWSVGLLQQTILYASVGDHTNSPENLAACRTFYFNPSNAINEAAQRLAPYWQETGTYTGTAAKWNAGPSGIWGALPEANRLNYAAAWATAAQYEGADVPTLTYSPNIPAVLQTDAWSCSVAATTWLLQSLGVDVVYPAMEWRMQQAGLVTPALGLLDGSGAALAAWLQATYGLPTAHAQPVDWAWAIAHAGRGPLLLGGAAWNHWTGVRYPWQNDGTLELANPAPGYQGVDHTLTTDDFQRLGPFAAVFVEVESQAMIADLQQQLADLKAKYDELDSYTSALGHDILLPTVAELHAAAANEKATKLALRQTLERVALRLEPYVKE